MYESSGHKAEKRAGLFGSSKPVTDQDSARVEPTFKDFKLSEVVQGLLINALQPKPVVDTIREEEKYGNNGDYFTDIGKKIVGGFEGLSVALNRAVDIPMDFARKVSSGLTDTLNNLGGKLIGLN